MVYYEIYFWNGCWEIWRWTYTGHGERFKVYKTEKAVRRWADRQWAKVIWKN